MHNIYTRSKFKNFAFSVSWVLFLNILVPNKAPLQRCQRLLPNSYWPPATSIEGVTRQFKCLVQRSAEHCESGCVLQQENPVLSLMERSTSTTWYYPWIKTLFQWGPAFGACDSPPASFWSSGTVVVKSKSDIVTQLPPTSVASESLIVLTGAPRPLSTKGSFYTYQAQTDGQPGGTATLVFKSTGTATDKDTSMTKYVSWMVVQTGIYRYSVGSDTSNPVINYVYAGRESVKPPDYTYTAQLQHPTDSSSLFKKPVIVAQIQNAGDKSNNWDAVVSVTFTSPSTATFKVLPVTSSKALQDTYVIGFFVLESDVIYGASDTTLSVAPFAVNTASDATDKLQYLLSIAGPSACGEPVIIASPLSPDNAVAYIPVLPTEGNDKQEAILNPTLSLTCEKAPCPQDGKKPTALHAIAWYQPTGCGYKDILGLKLLPATAVTTTPKPPEVYNSSTIIWVAVIAVVGCLCIGGILYYCCAPRGKSGPDVPQGFGAGGPGATDPWGRPGFQQPFPGSGPNEGNPRLPFASGANAPGPFGGGVPPYGGGAARY